MGRKEHLFQDEVMLVCGLVLVSDLVSGVCPISEVWGWEEGLTV